MVIFNLTCAGQLINKKCGLLKNIIICSGIFISAATLVGCSSMSPKFNGLSARNGAIFANATIFEFDKAQEPMKDLTPYTSRDYGFRTNIIREGNKDCIVAHNRRELPVSVAIKITAEENLASDREFPFYYVVPPNSDICIARLFPLDKSKNHAFRTSSSWMAGDYAARHNPQGEYRVPWPTGESYTVSQAPDGPITTHFDPLSRNAIDFVMPEGTTVNAARSGIVVGTEASFKAGGNDRTLLDKANYVDVLHDDGTVASYAHLKENSLAVTIGQRVSAGEKLALSGSTGYSSGPHLHFSVWTLEKRDKGFERVSLPVEFCFDGNPQCTYLQYGMTVSAQGITYNGRTEKNPAAMLNNVNGVGKPQKINDDSYLGLNFALIKGGCIQKRAVNPVAKGTNNKLCVDDFLMGKHEVTQWQWENIMGSNPSYYKQCGPDCPVENVSWDDVQMFITKLNKQTGGNYRLPTEAEWEFAAGDRRNKWKYSGSDNVDDVAWYKGNSEKHTHTVAKKKPNGSGLFDMSGNVWEWVADWWSEQGQTTVKHQGISQAPPLDSFRVMRGGCYGSSQDDMLISLQGFYTEPSTRSKEIGFRLARSAKR